MRAATQRDTRFDLSASIKGRAYRKLRRFMCRWQTIRSAGSAILDGNMRLRWLPQILVLLMIARGLAQAPAFPPLEQWTTALTEGNAGALRSFYSNLPPAQINTTAGKVGADSEIAFWTGLKAKSIKLTITESAFPQTGIAEIMFQAAVTPGKSGRAVNVLEEQVWQQQNGIWRILAAKRDITRLEQPVRLDTKIYPEDSARQDVHSAVQRAVKAHKRVLVVFGADWCYDCHVLERAFKRQDIAAVLGSNYEVVHVDVGEGDKNQDLMNEYQVPMKRGIPALAVLDSSGKLIYSQRNGEFERARALGPEDLLAFLRKWRAQPR